jgi:hypothetical protein
VDAQSFFSIVREPGVTSRLRQQEAADAPPFLTGANIAINGQHMQ